MVLFLWNGSIGRRKRPHPHLTTLLTLHVAHAILTAGLLLIYGRLNVSGAAASSSTLLELNVLAFGLGIAAAFFINERITVRVQSDAWEMEGKKRIITRLLKYEGVNGLGNTVTVLVQLLLLGSLAVSPVLGNIIGAIVAYPITYFFSMRFVWKAQIA